MKKNITINMFGSLYAIDEDAYALLQQYLSHMKNYFRSREGGEEIADDIERRVEELFAELKAAGREAISIEDVQQIMHRIGDPGEMDDEAARGAQPDADADTADEQGDTPPPPPLSNHPVWRRIKAHFANRKLYRDIQDKLLGGVMSGLCKFFGGNDPTPWRILMVLLCFLSFYTVAIAYLVLWAVVPPALTSEDRLRMEGRIVSPQNINEELIHRTGQTPAAAATGNGMAAVGSGMSSIVRFIVTCCKLLLLLMLGFALMCVIMGLVWLATSAVLGWQTMADRGLIEPLLVPVMQDALGVTNLWFAAGLSAIVGLGVLLYCVLRWLIRGPQTQPMRTGTAALLAAVAVLSLTASVVLFIAGGASMSILKQRSHLGPHVSVSVQTADGEWGDDAPIVDTVDVANMMSTLIHTGNALVVDTVGVASSRPDTVVMQVPASTAKSQRSTKQVKASAKMHVKVSAKKKKPTPKAVKPAAPAASAAKVAAKADSVR